MAQAETTLQQRIDSLDRKLTPAQLEELRALVALIGLKLTPSKADKPSNHPSDIATFYASVGV